MKEDALKISSLQLHSFQRVSHAIYVLFFVQYYSLIQHDEKYLFTWLRTGNTGVLRWNFVKHCKSVYSTFWSHFLWPQRTNFQHILFSHFIAIWKYLSKSCIPQKRIICFSWNFQNTLKIASSTHKSNFIVNFFFQ